MNSKLSFISALLLLGTAGAQQNNVQTEWGQCAGSSYAGPTACPVKYYCSFGNPWYSQCIPGVKDDPIGPGPVQTSVVPTVVTITEGPRPSTVTTYITYLTPRPTSTPGIPGVKTTVINGVTYTLVPDLPPRTVAADPAFVS